MNKEEFVLDSQVTIMIPFYNPGRYLSEALDSVFEQTYEKWKLILIDDCSTEDYLPSIKKYLNDERVKLLHNHENLGQSKSLNLGLKSVETPYVVQLDHDDMFYPDTLKVMVKAAEKLPIKVGLLCGNMFIFFEDRNGNIKRTKIRKGRSFTDRYDFLLAKMSLAPRFYRTSALKKINGWPTNDPYGGRYREDMILMYSLIEHYHFHWIDKELYKHRQHQTNMTRKVKLLSEIREWSIRKALKRWGDEYKPVFKTKDGQIKLSHLVPKKTNEAKEGK